jgi:LuxR family transcriptional regulator, maltose regulon positive regulatory protein
VRPISRASAQHPGARPETPRSGSKPTPVLATKLQAPAPRGRLVPRQGLLEQLTAGEEQRLTLVAAPAGWGKTTLLAAWQRAERHVHPFAWLSMDPWDNDPARFWTYVVEAIRTVEPGVGDDALALLGARGVGIVEEVIPSLLRDLEQLSGQRILVLDDYHLIEDEEVHEGVGFLLAHLPGSLRLVIASRFDPPLPVARLRARGELLEIRAEKLRFSREESAVFLNDLLGLGLEPDDVARLHERTEGWAAGLYLAALSLGGQADPHTFIAAFAGDDRHVVDYLAAEVLRGQPEEIRSFMLRTSVLDRLSGPLCDAVTGTVGSAALLRRIERANLFLVPLDPKREWYRYHHLFRDLLQHELRQAEPGLVPELHRRAAVWQREADSIPDAIHHALAAGDVDEARELIARHWSASFNQGRLATVSAWLDALPGEAVSGDPRLSIARAWLALDRRLLDEVEPWIDAAEANPSTETRVETAVLRAVFSFKIGDVGRASEAAEQALGLASPDAVFPRTAAGCISGICRYWSGDPSRAVPVLAETAELARSAGNDLAAGYALGYLALIEAGRDRPEAAEELAARALGESDEPGFQRHFVTMVAHLARAKACLQRRAPDEAESAAARAVALALRGAGHLELAAAQLTLAEAKRLRGEVGEADGLVRDARALLAGCPDSGTMAGLAERRPETREAEAAELTERERAVLHLLDTDLSQREISSALYVSLNTVKTHTRGIFRKLNASSRREAVERARARGLLRPGGR